MTNVTTSRNNPIFQWLLESDKSSKNFINWFDSKARRSHFFITFADERKMKIQRIVLVAILIGLLSPLLFVVGNVFSVSSDGWYHLSQNLLGTYVKNTFIVVLGVFCVFSSSAFEVASSDIGVDMLDP